MRQFLALLLVSLLSVTLLASNADARRMGGGKSFGYHRSYSGPTYSPRQPSYQPAPSYRPQPAPAYQPPARSGSRWLGPLAGFAGGALLGSMLFGHGVGGFFGGGGLLGWLILIGIIWLVIRLFRGSRREEPPYQAPYQTEPEVPPYQQPQYQSYAQPQYTPAYGGGPAGGGWRPPGWNDEAFLRQAKTEFIRLQAAFDARDLNDIRQYTTPEVFGEVAMQIQEMGSQPNYTEVTQLNAEMLDVVEENGMLVASVRYSGMIKESRDEPPHPFAEIWHFERPVNQPDAPFRIAGIQQEE